MSGPIFNLSAVVRTDPDGLELAGVPLYYLTGVVKAKSEEMEDFSGPLDLILHLLSKNKMEIQDIQLSVILSQYLEWMESKKELDLEIASEFATMAAQLIFIKSRMLLSINDEEALSEMEILIASLEAHQRRENYLQIKEVIPALSRRYQLGRDYIEKGPEHLPVNKVYRYVHKSDDLRRAMINLRDRMGSQMPPPMSAFEGIVGREPYPVADKASELVQRLIESGVARFKALFKSSQSRSEVVATFIAVLELCKAKRVHLAGEDDECTITCTGIGDNDIEISTDAY